MGPAMRQPGSLPVTSGDRPQARSLRENILVKCKWEKRGFPPPLKDYAGGIAGFSLFFGTWQKVQSHVSEKNKEKLT